jgi:hypothetical protein
LRERERERERERKEEQFKQNAIQIKIRIADTKINNYCKKNWYILLHVESPCADSTSRELAIILMKWIANKRN